MLQKCLKAKSADEDAADLEKFAPKNGKTQSQWNSNSCDQSRYEPAHASLPATGQGTGQKISPTPSRKIIGVIGKEWAADVKLCDLAEIPEAT